MLFYYIRHGDPVYEPDSLTPLGHEQAKAVAKRLALHGIDKVYCSTSNRAQLTARPLCDLLKKEPELLDWCHEDRAHDYFHITRPDGGKTWAVMDPETKKRFLSKEICRMGDLWYTHPAFENTNFAKGVELFGSKTDALLASHGYVRDGELNCYRAERPNEDRIAIFAHWGVSNAVISHILGVPYPQFAMHFTMSHTGVTVIEFREVHGMVVPKALTMANDSHIYKEGLPTKFANRIYI